MNIATKVLKSISFSEPAVYFFNMGAHGNTGKVTPENQEDFCSAQATSKGHLLPRIMVLFQDSAYLCQDYT